MLSLRFPTMPALVSDIIIDTDSESEDETLPKTPPNTNSFPSDFHNPPPQITPHSCPKPKIHCRIQTSPPFPGNPRNVYCSERPRGLTEHYSCARFGTPKLRGTPHPYLSSPWSHDNPLIAFSYVCPHRVVPNLTCDLLITYLGAENGVLPAMPIGHGIFSPGS